MNTETIVQNVWTKSKLLIKSMIIGILVLVLQIPAMFVRDVISEREQRQQDAIAEVSSKWAGHQVLTGPVLVIPYWQSAQDSSARQVRTRQYAYFLPDKLDMTARVTPQERHRGIYKVMLYSSEVSMSGSFSQPALQRLNIAPSDVIWNEATIKLPISDNKGLNEEIFMKLNDSSVAMSPQIADDPSIDNALQGDIHLTGPDDLKQLRFSSSFVINGSQQIAFTPIGKNTTVNLTSAWPHPSFIGDVLPQSSEVNTKGFTASWKSAFHKHNFPQQWKGNAYRFSNYNYAFGYNTPAMPVDVVKPTSANNINMSSFGADLFVPVNGYQKTMRSIKYAALVILLTFASFFLIETTNKRSIHPFQYGLIGLALILFYTLLLSFSEYISFNISYVIASFCTITLISWFVRGLLASSRLTVFLSTILVLLYVYVFTLLQLQDYSLLLGSIGLFITLALIMHFSRRIQW
ncbi:MAG TPA: cell envelope integrity protein CreD [Flavisolibacter sp.]|nr:cell envelope integrity protein CreD [Flavisolibacter sp.]